MSDQLKLLWIDDESDRQRLCDDLGLALGVESDFKDVRGRNLRDELKTVMVGEEPSMILIDHRFDKVSESILGEKATELKDTGSTVSEIIRDKWPECPIICITEVELDDIESHKRLIYEDIFKYNDLLDNFEKIKSIFNAFNYIKEKKPSSIDDVLKLINVPEDDLEQISSIIPEHLKNPEKIRDKSIISNLSYWVRQHLIKKPGFLLDELWSATLLGLNVSGFNKISSDFKDALYTGIFADESNPRWWQSQLRAILYEITPSSDIVLPWMVGRNIKGVTTGDYSVCNVCHEDFPETVGYTDDAMKTLMPMHIKCSVKHPYCKSEMFFEEIRKMKGAE